MLLTILVSKSIEICIFITIPLYLVCENKHIHSKYNVSYVLAIREIRPDEGCWYNVMQSLTNIDNCVLE